MTAVIVIGVIVAVVIGFIVVGQNMSANNTSLGVTGPQDAPRIIGLNYLGGHPKATGAVKRCNLVVTAREIAIEKGPTIHSRVPLSDVSEVIVETEQEATRRLTATRMLAVGVFALAIPKKTPGSVLITIDTDQGPLIFEREKATKATVLRQMGPAMVMINKAVSARPEPIDPPAPAALPPPSVADELEKLVRLRDSGALTADEFDRQKRRLLDG